MPNISLTESAATDTPSTIIDKKVVLLPIYDKVFIITLGNLISMIYTTIVRTEKTVPELTTFFNLARALRSPSSPEPKPPPTAKSAPSSDVPSAAKSVPRQASPP